MSIMFTDKLSKMVAHYENLLTWLEKLSEYLPSMKFDLISS